MESPEKIGKFRVLRLLGQGAMGRVFLAEDPLIDRQVAIKVMTAEGDDEARERFRNEARTAGQLSHPNIVQLHEFGFHQGQPYLVMEYLVGESLDHWLARPQPLAAKLSILLDLCQAIGHAHSRDVLHRDVKPSNLQVLPDGACKLVDFGIARSRSVRLTATGMILGTPEFIAPEVLQDAGYSTRSDLFAVGLVAYQVLAGANPFHANTLEGCLTRVLTHEPPPLAEASAEAPAELSDVISSYLCKVPEERPADVRPLTATLRSLQDRTLRLDSVPPLAPPPTAPSSLPPAATEAPTLLSPSGSAAHGRRLPAAAALLAALGIVLAVTMSWRPWSDPAPPAEVTAPPPSSADASPAEDTRPAEAGTVTGLAGTPPASRSSPDLTPQGTATDTDTDPGPAAAELTTPEGRNAAEPQAAPPLTPRSEKVPEDGPAVVAAPEPGPPPPPDHDAAESATQEAETNLLSAEGGPPLNRPPAAQSAPEEVPIRELPAGEALAGEASLGESAGDLPGVEPPTAAPRIDRLDPIVVRRGSTAILQIIGEGFGPETEVVLRRGGRVVRALRILSSKTEGTSKLHVTLLVDRQLPLGTYAVTVAGADGRESNSAGLEVGL